MAKRFIQNNLLAFSSVSLGISMVAGWICFSLVERRKPPLKIEESSSKSHEQLRFQAMVENAQSSDWTDNLKNAFEAQARFMLPGRHHRPPDFLEKIEQRADDLQQAQQRQTRTQHFAKERETAAGSASNAGSGQNEETDKDLFWK